MHRFLGSIGVVAVLGFALGCARNAPSASSTQQAVQPSSQLIATEHTWREARWQARNAVLSDLSAPHRVVLARLIGELSVAPQPDVSSAVRTLDATLDNKEKASIAWVGRTLQKSWLPFWDAEHESMPDITEPTFRGAHQTADPGASLLDLTINGIAFHTSVSIRQNARVLRGQASKSQT